MSILNPKIDRRRGGRRTAFVTGALVLAMVIPLSVSGFWSVQAQEKTDKAKEKQKSEQLKDEKAKSEQLTEEQIKKEEMSPEKSAGLMWEKLMANENSAAAKVGMVMKEKGVKEGIRTFMALKEEKSDAVYFKEAEFNSLGYVFLFGKKLDEAIAILELNVKEYPDSWNVYDSLGEAFLTAGSLEKAAKNYEMAIKLNPESEVSIRMLEKVRKQMKIEA
jgi:tetratricopeptide (TPR) repeat protein